MNTRLCAIVLFALVGNAFLFPERVKRGIRKSYDGYGGKGYGGGLGGGAGGDAEDLSSDSSDDSDSEGDSDSGSSEEADDGPAQLKGYGWMDGHSYVKSSAAASASSYSETR